MGEGLTGRRRGTDSKQRTTRSTATYSERASRRVQATYGDVKVRRSTVWTRRSARYRLRLGPGEHHMVWFKVRFSNPGRVSSLGRVFGGHAVPFSWHRRQVELGRSFVLFSPSRTCSIILPLPASSRLGGVNPHFFSSLVAGSLRPAPPFGLVFSLVSWPPAGPRPVLLFLNFSVRACI